MLLCAVADTARAQVCDASERYCGYFRGRSSSSSGGAPTRGSKVRINPSAVPIEKGLGIEAIVFDGTADMALVKGLGRVGAAISPSNSEETFFGPPGIELPENFADRKTRQKKFPSQKLTLATAIGLISNKRSGLSRFEVNLGVMGKYNRATKAITPGGGLSGVAGPLTFGYSLYSDQTQLDYGFYQVAKKPVVKYMVETYSIGAFLNSLAVDYSILRLITNDISTTSVLTGTLLLKRWLLTLAARRESSVRPAYNYTLKALQIQRDKNESFAGAQFSINQHVMVGLFYNYYVLHEISAGATLFF